MKVEYPGDPLKFKSILLDLRAATGDIFRPEPKPGPPLQAKDFRELLSSLKK